MEYIIINHYELAALSGLPFIQQLTYIQGLKPYVDYRTGLIGIKRGVSYQSITEALYIEPHPGIQSGSPSKNQIRRAVNGLEKAGLIAIQSLDAKLVFKCLLLDRDNSVSNKADTKPTYQTDTRKGDVKPEKSSNSNQNTKIDDTPNSSQPDIPQNNNNYLFFLLNAFEDFWELYPLKNDKDATRDVFKKLNPSKELIAEIKTSLQQQIEFYQQQQMAGVWMPAWKYPTNWLTQQSWKNVPVMSEPQQENQYATHQQHSGLQKNTNTAEFSGHPTRFSDAEFDRLWKTH